MTDEGPSARTPHAEYLLRVNRVIDYIERNLGQPLSLAALAEVAHFSPYHFHRVFGAVVGEPLNQFIRRLRVEKAAAILVGNPRVSITEVALDCGFSSSATFARTFNEVFGVSGTQWRNEGTRKICEANRKNRKPLRNECNAKDSFDCYLDPQTHRPTWRYTMSTDHQPLHATIEIQEQPEHHVAYLRHVGPYGQVDLVPRLADKLLAWASARGLYGSGSRMLLVAHDSPTITDEDKLRLSVCVTVPEGTKTEGEVGAMKIPGGTFAVGHFEIPPQRIAEAWNVVMGGWLPRSGYEPDDRLCYEEVLQNSRQHPEGKVAMDICVPVRPLRG